MKKICFISFIMLFLCFSMFSEGTTVTKNKNVVDISIKLKTNGDIEIEKASKTLPGDPEKRIIIIKDSDTGNPVPQANVEIDKKWDVITSNEGKADLPDDVEDGEHSMVVTKDGVYVRTESTFSVENGEITTAVQISVPKIVDYERFKIVLDWGEYPYDLDSHILSNRYHVYYSNMNALNLNLDRDDTTSYGPETVTVRDIALSPIYQYYVFDYSNRDYPWSTAMANSGAQVRVFYNNELVATFDIKPDQPGILWHVFDIVNGSEIIKYDTITGDRI